jgi:hypothetical protein
LRIFGKGVLSVARVDPLRGVTDEKVLLPFHARLTLQHGDANLFGGTRINRGLIDNDGTLFHIAADTGAGPDEGAEVGDVGVVNGSRYRDYDDVGLGQQARVGGIDSMRGCTHFIVRQFTRRVDTPKARLNLGYGNVKPNGAHVFSKLHDQWQAHITQPDYSNNGHLKISTEFNK